MSRTPRSRTVLPPAPATLPDGTLDCDPEIPTFPALAERQAEQIAQTLHLVNTPADVLVLERLRREELEHASATAQARAEVPRRKRRASRDAGRSERYQNMIAQATRDASSVKMFCEFLDGRDVPLPRSLSTKGVKTWAEAYGKTELRSIIRGIKRRSLLEQNQQQ
jgi:hypothetical protein